MSESLREQLLKAGFAARPKPASQPTSKPASKPASPTRRARQTPPARLSAGDSSADIDLARAYALRDRSEREAREIERHEAERLARERKERKRKLGALLAGKPLNVAEADIPRHFPHRGRIRRIYVSAAQLAALNGGELAVLHWLGRYLLVTRETALAAQEVDPDVLALLCEAGAADEDGVPADLMW